jgi:hypothetical protein
VGRPNGAGRASGLNGVKGLKGVKGVNGVKGPPRPVRPKPRSAEKGKPNSPPPKNTWVPFALFPVASANFTAPSSSSAAISFPIGLIKRCDLVTREIIP